MHRHSIFAGRHRLPSIEARLEQGTKPVEATAAERVAEVVYGAGASKTPLDERRLAMIARRLPVVLLLVLSCLLATGGWRPAASARPTKASKRAKRAHAVQGTSDLAAARALFATNLQAIRDRDGTHYLACYLDATHLPRTLPDGFQLGRAG